MVPSSQSGHLFFQVHRVPLYLAQVQLLRRSLQKYSPCLQHLQAVAGWEEGASEPGRFE